MTRLFFILAFSIAPFLLFSQSPTGWLDLYKYNLKTGVRVKKILKGNGWTNDSLKQYVDGSCQYIFSELNAEMIVPDAYTDSVFSEIKIWKKHARRLEKTGKDSVLTVSIQKKIKPFAGMNVTPENHEAFSYLLKSKNLEYAIVVTEFAIAGGLFSPGSNRIILSLEVYHKDFGSVYGYTFSRRFHISRNTYPDVIKMHAKILFEEVLKKLRKDQFGMRPVN